MERGLEGLRKILTAQECVRQPRLPKASLPNQQRCQIKSGPLLEGVVAKIKEHPGVPEIRNILHNL
jgi:hypothetical protein